MNYLRTGLLLLPLIACGPDPGSDDSGSDTTAPATTTEPTPTTGTTTETATGTTTDSATGAPTTTPESTTTGDPSAATEITATSEPATTGPVTGTGEDDSGTTGADALQLDPATLTTFALPINSIRFAVAGHDAAHALCVAVIFTNNSIDHQLHCDAFDPGDVYVVIEPGAAPCMNWDYAPNVELEAVSGCMQLISDDPAQIDLDMALQVSGDLFTGEIHVSNL